MDIEEHIRKLTTPILNNFISPKEPTKHTMGVSPKTQKDDAVFYWRPNGYRLKIPFSRENFNLGVESTLRLQDRKGSVHVTKHNQKVKISNFGNKVTGKIDGIRYMLDKDSITMFFSLMQPLTPKRFKRAYYRIKADTIRNVDNRMKQRVKKIKKTCVSACKKLTKLYGGKADIKKAQWIRFEDALHMPNWIPSDDDLIIHDTDFKKVYKDEIEFKSPTKLKTFIQNRMIEDVLPQLSENIEDIKKTITNNQLSITESIKGSWQAIQKNAEHLEFHAENMRSHIAAIQELTLGVKELREQIRGKNSLEFIKSSVKGVSDLLKPEVKNAIKTLSKDQKSALDAWLFNNI